MGRKIRFCVMLLLVGEVVLMGAGGKTAMAKGESYILSASGKLNRSYGIIYRYKKISFQGRKVTFQGNILKIPKGKGKEKIVKELTLKLEPDCKFYFNDGEGNLSPAKKKDRIRTYQKLNFQALFVTVKNGKVVQFEDGRFD